MYFFYKASVADPGRVTAANVLKIVAAFPYDQRVYVTKQCRTCNMQRCVRLVICPI